MVKLTILSDSGKRQNNREKEGRDYDLIGVSVFLSIEVVLW